MPPDPYNYEETVISMYERLGRGFSGEHLMNKHLQRKTGAKARKTEMMMMAGGDL
jgi:hypothetical protein